MESKFNERHILKLAKYGDCNLDNKELYKYVKDNIENKDLSFSCEFLYEIYKRIKKNVEGGMLK